MRVDTRRTYGVMERMGATLECRHTRVRSWNSMSYTATKPRFVPTSRPEPAVVAHNHGRRTIKATCVSYGHAAHRNQRRNQTRTGIQLNARCHA